MSKPSVALIYGFGEGEWHGEAFKAALVQAGFRIVRDSSQADIVIAHSAGCFYLPETPVRQLTVLIGPPYWPGKSVVLSFFQKTWRDYKDYASRGLRAKWLYKTMRNSLYIVGGLRKAMLIGMHARRHNFYEALRNKQVVIVRNHDDAWLTPDAPKLLKPRAAFRYYELPGQHDDCWLNPLPYIQVLQSVV